MRRNSGRRLFITVVAWTAALVLFFPIAWMVLVSFKTEVEAIDSRSLFSIHPTLGAYGDVLGRTHYWAAASNSLVEAGGATLVALVLAIPATYAMAFWPTQRSRGTLIWMLSTKMMPSVGVLVPIYLLFRTIGLLDTRSGLIVIYALMNLPIAAWMMFTFFKDIPVEILESGRMDGAGLVHEFWYLLLPLSLPGIASTALLSMILCWNETFWSLNLTTVGAAPLTQFVISFATPKALFLSKLSAASTLAVLPVLVLGV